MGIFETVLVLSAVLCALVAGFVFAFASVVMPGIRALDDREFLRAFQVMDGVIQRGQPIFMLVWVGSVFAIAAAVVMSFWQLAGSDLLLLILAAAIYLLGVQWPTATINVQLNNRLQGLDLDLATAVALAEARMQFESRWIRWNLVRTLLATLTSVLLVLLLLRL